MRLVFLIAVTTVLLVGCGGSDESSETANTAQGIAPNFSVDLNSSHTLQHAPFHIDIYAIRTTNPGTFATAVSYGDYNQDGAVDVFIAAGDNSKNTTPFELYLNDGADNFSLDPSFFNGNPPGLVFPRKAINGDFNGDGKLDIFVLGHGYDKPPFPGEAPMVLLSSANGFVSGTGLSALIGFHHGGASADIDADGDLDVFVTDINAPFFLINDGAGNFTKNTSRISGLNNANLFTAELVDLDKDGYVDLLVAGHEYERFSGRILWGSSSGKYTVSDSTLLPAVNAYGVTIDIDVADLDNDGDKDIVLNRTGDGTGAVSFYQGYYLQLIENKGGRQFADNTGDRLLSGSSAYGSAVDWIRLRDINKDGKIDIFVDDLARNLIWLNDGTGHFQ
ncbi:FG-GAP repeat domain-containing protein [Rheinheimera baltica]|uniref:FG-GAP repeat domain-containing protein n=1 Tax=Rheinheimera baltica TaxID=67576 RepID=UPI0004846921|nr:VCBS repeat-containing protein [Rheinheimera baltica]